MEDQPFLGSQGSDDSLAGEEETKQREESSKNVQVGMLIGFALEIGLCVIATLVYSTSYIRVMWGLFVFFVCCKLIAAGLVCYSNFFKVLLVMLFVTPFLPYSCTVNLAVTSDCDVVQEEKLVQTMTTGIIDTYIENGVECETQKQWISDIHKELQLNDFIPLVIDFVVPLVIAAIFVQGARDFEVDMSKSQTPLQLSLLNFVDVGGLLTLPFTITGNIFFRNNTAWFVILLISCCVGWFTASAEMVFGVLHSLEGTMKKHANNVCIRRTLNMITSDRFVSILSLSFIDLWFGIFRTYLYLWCGVEVNPIYLGKNYLCALFEIAHICKLTPLKNFLEQLIGRIPGVDAVSAEAENYEKIKKMKQIEAKARKQGKEQALAEVTGKDTSEKAKMRSKQKKAALALMDLVLFDGFEPDTALMKYQSQVENLFEVFDSDSSGKLSLAEIVEAFCMEKEGAYVAAEFTAWIEDNDDDIIDPATEEAAISDIAKAFIQWRVEEDNGFNLDDDDDDTEEDHDD